MQAKVIVFGIVYLLGGNGVMVLSGNNAAAVFAWFLFFGLAQLVLFRCPNCRRVAVTRSPIVRDKCRHCGRDY